MTDPLRSSKYSINHAERRINELIGIIDAFVKTNPCKAIAEEDAHTGEHVLKLKLVKPMPSDVPGFIFDALNNLRATLDQAGFAAAVADGKSGGDAHFPFGNTLNEVLGRFKGKGRSREIPKNVFDVMVASKPYLGGNDILWALNNLCNGNKHEMIIPDIPSAGTLAISISRTVEPIRWSHTGWDRTKNERELARIGPGAKFNDYANVYAAIAFDEMQVVGLRPVDNVLRDMLVAVRSTLDAIEAEGIRSGLFR